MVTTPRKTFPELQALTAPVVDSDVLAVYRSPGPAKRTTATVFSDYIKAFFSASGGSALVGFLNAGTGAVTRTLQAWLRERPASVLDYYDAGDGNDYGPALVRALAAAPNVVFPPKSDGYRFASYVSHTLTRDSSIDGNGQTLILDQGRVQISGATIFSGRTLAANAVRYATSITLSSAASLQVGDLLHIQTTIAPSSSWPVDYKQDCVEVQAISGAVVTLSAALNFAYNTADAGLTITAYRPYGLSLLNANIDIVAADADTTTYVAYLLTGLRNVKAYDVSVTGSYPFSRETNIYRNGIWVVSCWNVETAGNYYEAVSYGAGVYGGTRLINEFGTVANYCHHGNADPGQWASDYALDGLITTSCYQGLSTHAVFRATATNVSVREDVDLSNWRVCGGSIRNSIIATKATDASVTSTPQFQNSTPNSGYEYINTDADFEASNVTFDAPGLTTDAPFGVRYGRTVSVSGVQTPVSPFIGLASGEVASYQNGQNNRVGSSAFPAPAVVDIYTDSVRSVANPRFDAAQVSFRRVLNLRNTLIDQSSYNIRCYGQVIRRVDNGASVLRLHVNPFAGRSPAILTGRITLRASVTSATPGSVFSSIEKDFEFCVVTGGSAALDFNTTPTSTRGPASSSGGADITLTVSSPTLISGTLPDPHFDITINHDTSVGVTSPKFTIEYDLVLSDIGA
jgi:hypothetical protein